MAMADNERRISALEASSQRKDVCVGIKKRLEARVDMLESHVDGLRTRTTGILVAVILSLMGIAANLLIALARTPSSG